MKTYKLERTRIITEVFRITAESEDEAIDMLGMCDTVICGEGVEQIGLETLQSNIEFFDEVVEKTEVQS